MESVLESNALRELSIQQNRNSSAVIPAIPYEVITQTAQRRKVAPGYLLSLKRHGSTGTPGFSSSGIVYDIKNYNNLLNTERAVLITNITKPTITDGVNPQYLEGYGLLALSEIRYELMGSVIQRWNPYGLFMYYQTLLHDAEKDAFKDLVRLGRSQTDLRTDVSSTQQVATLVPSPWNSLQNTLIYKNLNPGIVSVVVDYAPYTNLLYLGGGSISAGNEPKISSGSLQIENVTMTETERNNICEHLKSQTIVSTVYDLQDETIPANTDTISIEMNTRALVSDILFYVEDETTPRTPFTGIEVSEYYAELEGNKYPDSAIIYPKVAQAFTNEYFKTQFDTNLYNIPFSYDNYDESTMIHKAFADMSKIRSRHLQIKLPSSTDSVKHLHIMYVTLVSVKAENGTLKINPANLLTA